MKQVVARRDDNWKKLQQYVFDEREQLELRGPNRAPIWGERREYTWFIRDGFFVRSPTKFNGVTIGEAERRKSEADYLRQVQERDKRAARANAGSNGIDIPTDAPTPVDTTERKTEGDQPQDLGGVIRQNRPPQFISTAYFLRFKFEEGKYALVGHETVDGRDVLRIEYYPAKLFGGTDRRRNKEGTTDRDRAYDAAFQRMMNKVALVTLWVEPKAQQILKYTFHNLPLDFLPGQWLLHLDDLNATMTVGEQFPDVWLPHELELAVGLSLAAGRVDVRYALEYHDYRRADVGATIKIR